MATTTIEELAVTLKAQNDDFLKGMKEAQKETSFFQNTMSTMAGFIGGQAIIGAFNTAKDAVVGFMSDSINAATEAQATMNSLNNALASAGHFSEKTAQSFKDLASEIQATTKFEDDAVIASASLIESMARLDEEGLKRATRAAVDLSAGLGIDLKKATKLVGQAAAGETTVLKTYGIAIEEGKNKAESFANAMAALEGRFGGRAAAEAKTFAGSVASLGNALGDLKEEFGNVFTENLAIVNIMQAAKDVMVEFTGGVTDHAQAWRVMIGQVATYVIAFVQGPIKALDDMLQFFGKKTVLTDVVGALERMGEAAALGTMQMEQGMKATLPAVQNVKSEVQALTDTEIQRAEQGRELAIQAIEAMTEDSEVRNQIRQMELDTELAQIQAAENAKKITVDQSLMAQKAIKDKFAKEDLERANKLKAQEDEINKQKLQGYSTFLGGMSALAQSGNKQVASIGKAAAIANATMNAYVAIQNALANVPYPANIAAAAGIAIQAFANIAKIQGVGFEKGITEVPGIGRGDSFPALLAPRERVVDADTNSDLKAFLAEAMNGGGGGNIKIEIGLTDNAIDMIEAKLYERNQLGISRTS